MSDGVVGADETAQRFASYAVFTGPVSTRRSRSIHVLEGPPRYAGAARATRPVTAANAPPLRLADRLPQKSPAGGMKCVENERPMNSRHKEMQFAIEVFVRGHSAGRSRTFPCEASRVGPLWVMRDALRKNPRDYRKEEWIAYAVDASEVDAIARRRTRGRFFVCAMVS
jgi:hypothetical protein